MVSLWAWQAHLLLLLQTAASPGVDRVAVALSWLGNYDTYIYIVCVVLIVGGSETATELAVLTLLGMVSADFLKLVVSSQRPFQVLPIRALYRESAAGSAFPSGHAEVAASCYLWLADKLWPRFGLRALTLVAVPVGIGLSRLYLGVHWPIDVLAGWIVGTLLFLVTVRSRESISGRTQARAGLYVSGKLWWIVLAFAAASRQLGIDTLEFLQFALGLSGAAWIGPRVMRARTGRVFVLRATVGAAVLAATYAMVDRLGPQSHTGVWIAVASACAVLLAGLLFSAADL